ncbi:CHASE2 domain-containing protein [Litoribrevibacter albus]|uniref:Adenylate/guanylate cyclase domain-containing protein n=1 Tax=Litoribrevibacter albus TaxID=1473156 RepID=A0AA37SDQ8_9GAMM|nr:adenylate/guanylate cyclase domain-containing protein [Litoribrevibacter albus]GLQ33361.1 adenylate/guanylate cyclase domain-containing protein [Litoribrevibacter albus]
MPVSTAKSLLFKRLNSLTTKRVVRIVLSLSILLIFLLQASSTLQLTLLDALERFAYDVKLNSTAPHTLDDRIVIVDLDEKSLQQHGQWPWKRTLLAKMVNKLIDEHQVKSVSFDMVFAEPDTSDGLAVLSDLASYIPPAMHKKWQTQLNFDEQFRNAIKDRHIILGYVFNQSSDKTINRLTDANTRLSPSMRDKLQLVSPKGFTANLPDFEQVSALSGFFDNPIVDKDGVYRRVPLVQEYQGGVYPSLALGTVLVNQGYPKLSLDIKQEQDYASVEGVYLGQTHIATGALSDVYVPYRGGQESYPYVSATDVILSEKPIPLLKDKIILIGTTAPGLLDLRSTPLQKNYPGVEVHANLIAGILDGTTLYRPSYSLAIEFLSLLIIGLIIIFSPVLASPFKHLSLLSCLAIVHTVGNLYLWHNQLVINLISPLALIFTLLAFQTSWGFFVESRAKRHLAKLFSQYIPKELVNRMAEAPESYELNGESREMTVLFTDIRGFTHISEDLEPKELSKLMNEYLTPMTEIIHKHNGTIDKYMGDAIMAFWGAPLPDDRHRHNAIHAAEEMLEALERLNKRFESRNWPKLEIGIGINTGMMDVGNMGSEYRMAYTVLGDAVNLGSRLEGLTKSYGIYTIIGEDTQRQLSGIVCREIDRVKVKGKDRPVSIYEPIGYEDLLSPSEIQQVHDFNEMILKYRAQDWQGCLQIIQQLVKQSGPKVIYKVYLDRIRTYQKQSPGINWDGVFIHTTK